MKHNKNSETMTKQEKELYIKTLEVFGAKHQTTKAIEEMSELICEFARMQDGRTDPEKIREEIADVKIMMEQMTLAYGEERIAEWVKFKTARLAQTLKEKK